jgi:hypothetical protein
LTGDGESRNSCSTHNGFDNRALPLPSILTASALTSGGDGRSQELARDRVIRALPGTH